MIIRDIDYPFGGIEVIAVSDHFQLATIKGPYDEGKYSFLSTNRNILFPITHCFFSTKIFRHDNLDDIKLLNDVWENTKLSEKLVKRLKALTQPTVTSLPGEHVPELNSRVVDTLIFKFHEVKHI